MTTVLWLAVAIVVVQPFRAADTYPNAQSPEKAPAALVSALSGSASVERPRQAALNLFDWVSDGATVRVPRGATLTLVLSSGKRFELTGPARATVTPQGLSVTSGSIRELSAMPRLPRIAPISHRKDQGRSAAVRVRGPRISNLYPSEGSVTRAQSTEFTFDAVAGAAQYAVEVEDSAGVRVFQVQTQKTRVTASPALRPGGTYYWRVRTVDAAGAQARGEAEFRTLQTRDEEAREALERALASDDPHARALLAHVDFSLGLHREAGEGVQAALKQSPADPNLRAALLRLSQRLKSQ